MNEHHSSHFAVSEASALTRYFYNTPVVSLSQLSVGGTKVHSCMKF